MNVFIAIALILGVTALLQAEWSVRADPAHPGYPRNRVLVNGVATIVYLSAAVALFTMAGI